MGTGAPARSRGFIGDTRAVSAVEFALLFPVLLLLLSLIHI